MKHLQEIKGYGFQQNSHNIPLNSIKQLQDKHIIEQTLIDKCVKSMIKQRMSGCLINLERKRQQSEEKSISNSKIRQSKISSIFNYLNSSTKKQRYEKEQSKSNIQNSGHGQSNGQSKHQNAYALLRQSLSKVSQLKKKDYQDNYLLRRIHKKEYTQNDNKKGTDLSFISAIDHLTDDNLRNKSSNKEKLSLNTSPDEKGASRKSIKLPKLKSKMIVGSPTTVVKSYSKKNTQYNINQDLWRFLTNQPQFQSKQRNRKLSNSTAELNASVSQIISSKEVKSSLFKPTIPSTTREMYISYINNLPIPFKRLLNLTLSFFQIKLPAEVSALYYSSMLQELKKIHDRGWSFLGFLFWDIGKDGLITTNDIFNIFRELNQFLDEQQEVIESSQNMKKMNRYATKKKIQNEKKQIDEQKSGMDNAGRILQALKKKDQALLNRNNTITTSISQLQAQISLARTIVSQKQSIRNIQGVKKSVKILQDQVIFFNSQLSISSYENINVNELKQPQQSTISYLEQIMLTNQQVKYKQIEPLFSAGGKQLRESGENEQKMDILRKEMQMKISSSYQQCFISTEHNEETRMLRQKIENYKSDLKKFRERRNSELEKKSSENIKLVKQINYIRFVQGEMWGKIKEIVFLLLGSDG